MQNAIKMKTFTRNPLNLKRGLPNNKGRKVHLSKRGLNLNIYCPYLLSQLEVPGLLIEWAVLQALINDGELTVGAITKVLELWSAMCPCGRIIVVYDGTLPKSGW